MQNRSKKFQLVLFMKKNICRLKFTKTLVRYMSVNRFYADCISCVDWVAVQ